MLFGSRPLRCGTPPILCRWENQRMLSSWFIHLLNLLPSVLWHCWLGVRKSVRPLNKLSDEMLAWVSVWSEVQRIYRYFWLSWCHYHLIISCFIKIQIGLTFLVPSYSGCPTCPGKETVKWVFVCFLFNLVFKKIITTCISVAIYVTITWYCWINFCRIFVHFRTPVTPRQTYTAWVYGKYLIARPPYIVAKSIHVNSDYRISGRRHSPGLYPTPYFHFRLNLSWHGYS